MIIPDFAAKRHLIGLTIDQLAQHLGVNPRTIRGYESGRYQPGPGITDDLDRLVALHTQHVEHPPSDTSGQPRGWWVAAHARRLDK